MLTTALPPLTVSCVRHHPSHKVHLFSPRSLHEHSSSPRACATFVLNGVLSSARLKPFCSSQVVFTPMDPDVAADSPGGCSGHDPVLAPESPAARKRKPRRLREEGAVGVAIVISDTRGLLHADMIRSAAALLRVSKSATGVLGLVLTRWRLASIDAGRNEALGLHELERRRLQAGTLSGFVEYLCLATAAGVECRVVRASSVTSHSNDLNANFFKAAAATRIFFLKKNSPVKEKIPQVGVLPARTR